MFKSRSPPKKTITIITRTLYIFFYLDPLVIACAKTSLCISTTFNLLSDSLKKSILFFDFFFTKIIGKYSLRFTVLVYSRETSENSKQGPNIKKNKFFKPIYEIYR